MTICEKNVANYALLRCKTFSLKIWLCKMFDKYHVWSGATLLYHRSDNSFFSRVRVGQIRPISITNPNPLSLCITLLYHTHREAFILYPIAQLSSFLGITVLYPLKWQSSSFLETFLRYESEKRLRSVDGASAQSVHHLKLKSWKWLKKIFYF